MTANERGPKCEEELTKLLKKYNCTLQGIPSYIPRDDGTFHTVVGVKLLAQPDPEPSSGEDKLNKPK